jgi:hypothetical protein
MDERVRKRLLDTSNALSLYSAAPPSGIEEVFSFQPAIDMETTGSDRLSQFTIMLAQYLITVQVRFNTARVIASQKKKVLESKVYELLQKGAVEGKTLKEREANAVASDEELQALERDYDEAASERDLLEGLDKPIIELINAIKSELRRRAEERHYVERERH